jgi:hypothetical protein
MGLRRDKRPKEVKKFEKCSKCKPEKNIFCGKHLKQSKDHASGWISAEDNPAVHRRWDGTPT